MTEEQIKPNGQAAMPMPAAPTETTGTLLESIVDETVRKDTEHLVYLERRYQLYGRMARQFAVSGLFKTKDASVEEAMAQALVKIELGASMGFGPAESLQGIHIINGQTAVAASLRAARMQARGWTWEIQWLGTAAECDGCRLWLYYKGNPFMQPTREPSGAVRKNENGDPIMEHVSVSYTRPDAEKMLTTIWENGQKRRASILEKENWKMSPANMYFARAVTNAQRFHDPAALSVNIMSVEEAVDLDRVVEETEARNGSREKAALIAAQKKVLLRQGADVQELNVEANGPTAPIYGSVWVGHRAPQQDTPPTNATGSVQGETATDGHPAGAERGIPGASIHGSDSDADDAAPLFSAPRRAKR